MSGEKDFSFLSKPYITATASSWVSLLLLPPLLLHSTVGASIDWAAVAHWRHDAALFLFLHLCNGIGCALSRSLNTVGQPRVVVFFLPYLFLSPSYFFSFLFFPFFFFFSLFLLVSFGFLSISFGSWHHSFMVEDVGFNGVVWIIYYWMFDAKRNILGIFWSGRLSAVMTGSTALVYDFHDGFWVGSVYY